MTMTAGASSVRVRYPRAAEGLRALATMQRTAGTGLTLQPSPEPLVQMQALFVGSDRATRVPEGAGTSGIQRTVTVTPSRPVGWARVPDQGWGRRPKLHGMQGVRGSNPLSSTRHNAGRRWRITRQPMEQRAGQVRMTPSTTWMRETTSRPS